MGAVRALSLFYLLVNQQNHLDLPLNALEDTLKWFSPKKRIFQKQKMSKSANGKVDNLLAREFHQLHAQRIHKIYAAMEAVVYGAEKVSTS